MCAGIKVGEIHKMIVNIDVSGRSYLNISLLRKKLHSVGDRRKIKMRMYFLCGFIYPAQENGSKKTVIPIRFFVFFFFLSVDENLATCAVQKAVHLS